MYAPNVQGLPFNYTLQGVSSGLQGRNFTTTTGKICNTTAIHRSGGAPVSTTFKVQLWQNISWGKDVYIGAYSVPVNGYSYRHCWSPITNHLTYYLWFGFPDGGGTFVDGNGSVKGS